MRVLPLNDRHDRKGFDCGDAQLNAWLNQTARQHQQKGVSSTFVAVADEASTEVLGYYAISLAELLIVDLPAPWRRRLPNRVPVFRLGRLATAVQHWGVGLGEHLLFDAIERAMRVAQEVGGVGIVVNAKATAVDFYQRYGFEKMADHPHNLFLPL